MQLETFQTHAHGLLERLSAEIAQQGVDMTGRTKSSEVSRVALERACAFNPNPALQESGTVNVYDMMLSRFSTDLYNLMMNFAIRNLPQEFDQIALVLRNAPEPDKPA